LQQVAEHVRAADIEVAIASRGCGAELNGLRAVVLDGDLDVVIRVLTGKEGTEGILNIAEVATRGVTLCICDEQSASILSKNDVRSSLP